MWEQIHSNQRRSAILVIGMGLLLLVLGYVLGLYFMGSTTGGMIIALAVWGIMSLVALFQGDNILLALSRAKKIERDDLPQLYNVVEEMKIAAGLEYMPDIYIIDDPAPNAFATGRNPRKAAVAVTSGLLQILNRDELQGVIGHEISHIKHRDVQLMVISGVLLGTIVLLSWAATRYLFFGALMGGGNRRSSASGGGGYIQIIVLAVGIILMILAPLMAQLLYFAVSRKREYLADASSALYTRYPEGLASALEKLAASKNQLKSANKATAPMFIINPLHKKGMSASNLTSTHPPLAERIRILRSMAGGASLSDYDGAYRQAHGGGKGVMPTSGLAAAPVSLRSATGEKEDNKLDRARQVSDVLWRINRYRTTTCDCGTRLRVPQNFADERIKCPHCGRVTKI